MKKAFYFLFITVSLMSCKEDPVVECDGTVYSFANEVQPLLNTSCNTSGCHNSGSSQGDFTNYSGVLTKVSNGSLKSRITNGSMPEGSSLTMAQKKIIVCWVENGAPDN
jgi:hypothetical protein